MARSRLLGFVALLVAGVGIAHSATQSSAESELRKAVQEMLDAIAPGNADVWKRYLDERVLLVDENGVVRTKAEMLAEFSPLPPGLVGNLALDTFKMRQHGDIAVLAYEAQEHLDYHGQKLASRCDVSSHCILSPRVRCCLRPGQPWDTLHCG